MRELSGCKLQVEGCRFFSEVGGGGGQYPKIFDFWFLNFDFQKQMKILRIFDLRC